MNKNTIIDELLKSYSVPSSKTKEAAWEKLSIKLQPEKEKIFNVNGFLQIAAVLVLAVIFAFLADALVFVQKYSSDFAEQQIVVLQDDSKVILNPNSQLKVNYSFITGKRDLFLKGNALFDVEKGKEFSVKFQGGQVTVLGTRFSVVAYDNIAPEINCLSGKVKVKAQNEQKLLTQGEGAVITNQSEIKKIEVNKEKVLAEINGSYSWKNEKLEHIFNILEARFGYSIYAPDEIVNRKFTGTINMKDLEHTLEVLSFAMELKYSVNQKNKKVTFENKN